MVWIEIRQQPHYKLYSRVTTFAVVWIEILQAFVSSQHTPVTTFAVVWIEIIHFVRLSGVPMSPPSRWCGLKFIGVVVHEDTHGHHLRGGVD